MSTFWAREPIAGRWPGLALDSEASREAVRGTRALRGYEYLGAKVKTRNCSFVLSTRPNVLRICRRVIGMQYVSVRREARRARATILLSLLENEGIILL